MCLPVPAPKASPTELRPLLAVPQWVSGHGTSWRRTLRLLALCPLLPWGRAATMQVLLHLSLVLTVLNKPWRARGSNFIDAC